MIMLFLIYIFFYRMVNMLFVFDYVEDFVVLDEFLMEFLVKRIDFWFEFGDVIIFVSNFKGVIIKDVMKVIYK